MLIAVLQIGYSVSTALWLAWGRLLAYYQACVLPWYLHDLARAEWDKGANENEFLADQHDSLVLDWRIVCASSGFSSRRYVVWKWLLLVYNILSVVSCAALLSSWQRMQSALGFFYSFTANANLIISMMSAYRWYLQKDNRKKRSHIILWSMYLIWVFTNRLWSVVQISWPVLVTTFACSSFFLTQEWPQTSRQVVMALGLAPGISYIAYLMFNMAAYFPWSFALCLVSTAGGIAFCSREQIRREGILKYLGIMQLLLPLTAIAWMSLLYLLRKRLFLTVIKSLLVVPLLLSSMSSCWCLSLILGSRPLLGLCVRCSEADSSHSWWGMRLAVRISQDLLRRCGGAPTLRSHLDWIALFAVFVPMYYILPLFFMTYGMPMHIGRLVLAVGVAFPCVQVIQRKIQDAGGWPVPTNDQRQITGDELFLWIYAMVSSVVYLGLSFLSQRNKVSSPVYSALLIRSVQLWPLMILVPLGYTLALGALFLVASRGEKKPLLHPVVLPLMHLLTLVDTVRNGSQLLIRDFILRSLTWHSGLWSLPHIKSLALSWFPGLGQLSYIPTNHVIIVTLLSARLVLPLLRSPHLLTVLRQYTPFMGFATIYFLLTYKSVGSSVLARCRRRSTHSGVVSSRELLNDRRQNTQCSPWWQRMQQACSGNRRLISMFS